jgi:hypothetical protein
MVIIVSKIAYFVALRLLAVLSGLAAKPLAVLKERFSELIDI